MLQRRPRAKCASTPSVTTASRLLLIGSVIAFLACQKGTAPVGARPGGGALAPVVGNQPIDAEIAVLQAQLGGAAAGQPEVWNQLARALVRKARQSRDERFYAQADAAAARSLALAQGNPGAQQVGLAVLLSQHKFAEAYQGAAALLRQHPREPTLWAALGDAALELGDYDAALRAHQTMLDLKPDLRSYSRGAWLRYLTGDAAGAIELMGQAIDAGSPRDPESRAYCRVQLADLLVRTGKYPDARAALDLALRELPGYPPAHAARAALLLHASDAATEALSELALALAADPQISTRILYVEALEAAGRAAEAQAALPTLLRDGESQDPRSLALFLASRRQHLDVALRLARAEVARRPDLWSLDALAWAEERSGQHEAAWQTMGRALRLGTVDPGLAYHLGVIAYGRGDRAEARRELARALTLSPRWHRGDAAEARALLAQIPPG